MTRLIATLLLVALLTGCKPVNAPSQRQNSGNANETLRRAIGAEPATLDPARATDTFSFEVLRDLYEGLTTESANGQVIPGIAKSWTVNALDTQYTFNLRASARWSNGARVKAQDFVRAWRRVVDPGTGSPVADNLRPIVGASEIISGQLQPSALGVTATSQYTLVVRLSAPTPYFLQLLTHTALFPVYSDQSARTHSPKHLISDGPYVLSAWIPGENILLAKNKEYWDARHVRIDNVDYLFTPDENAELREYLAGEIDVTDSVPASAISWLKKKIPHQLHIWPFLGTAYYVINMRNPALHDSLALRKSLAMAIDRHLLVSHVLDSGQIPAYGFVPNGTWNYSPQSWHWKNLGEAERVAEARSLYKQAGYSRNKPLHIRLLINANSTVRDAALATAAMWKTTLGVHTRIVQQEYQVFLQTRRDPTAWDVARLGWTADYNDASDFLDIFRAKSPNNDSRYSNNLFDELMDKAARTDDAAQRRQLLQKAERIVLSDYPVIPIYFYVSERLVKPYVGGVHSSPMNRLYSKYLFLKTR